MSDDFDLDFAVDFDGLDDPDATKVRPTAASTPAIFIFEPEGDAATEGLQRAGITVQRATMGSEMMAAAQKQALQCVLVAPHTDPELRELFMRAFRGKFPNVPVIYLSEQFDDEREQAQYRYEGATSALPWPLPSAEELVKAIATLTHTPIEVAADLIVQPGSEAEHNEIAVLKRKVAAIEQRHQAVTPEELERERERVQQKVKEATSLRSELTLVRERSQMLQDRIDRVVSDLATMTKERDRLKLKLAKMKDETSPRAGSDLDPATLKSLRKIGQSADSFVWGLEQAIQFFEELQFEAGDKRAPSLKGHVRSLKLVRALLERIRDRLHEL